MTQITKLPIFRHLRSERSRHVIHFRGGRRIRSGRGLAFWFLPLSASVVEVPTDDRDLPFLFHVRSKDFQDVTVQGAVTYRVADADALAERVDFTIHLNSGNFRERPLEKLAELFTQRAQQLATDLVAERAVRDLLAAGLEPMRERIEEGLSTSAEIAEMGLEIVAVSVSAVAPSAELEKALQTPAHEAIQQQADEAMFARRASAVEKERAIAENELQNQIELAKREASLIEGIGANERSRAEEEAAAKQIAAEAQLERSRLTAQGEAEGIAAVEGAKVEVEERRMTLYRDLEPHVMMGLAAREFAGKLRRIDRLHVAPESIGPLIGDLVEAGTKALRAGKSKE